MSRGSLLLLRHEPLACATVLALGAGACALVLARAATVPRCLGVAALSVMLTWLAHGTRRDERFLRGAGVAHRRVFAAEYGAASVPAALLLAASAHPWTAAAPFAGVLAALFPSGRVGVSGVRMRTILRVPGPAEAFEWKAGLRNAAPGIAVVYLLSALLARIPAVALLGVLALAWIAAGMYHAGEGWPMVEAPARGPARFLRRKVALALAHWGVLVTPLAVLVLAAHGEVWLALAGVLAGCAVVVGGAVLLKYALYFEGRGPGLAHVFGVLGLTVSLAIPPVTLFLLHRFWRLAVRNLDPYLYAFD